MLYYKGMRIGFNIYLELGKKVEIYLGYFPTQTQFNVSEINFQRYIPAELICIILTYQQLHQNL